MADQQNFRRRILRGLGATALGPILQTIIQLGTVPVLIKAWGAAKYGDWLMLSAIPSYLSIANLGLGDASGSDMTMRVAAGDREGALQTLQSSWALLVLVSTAVCILGGLAVWSVPWTPWLHLSSLSSRQAAAVIAVLGFTILVMQQAGIIESGYRSDGNYAAGTFWPNIIRLIEVALGCAAGVITGSLLWTAAVTLFVRILGTIFYYVDLRRRSPWMTLGFEHVRLQRIRELARPAMAFVVLPLSGALSIQGFTLMIGHLQGPIAVTIFSTLRTLSRLSFQLVTTVGFTLWPELSAAFGAGDLPLATRLHRRTFQASLFLALAGSGALWVAGPFVYEIWLRHSVPFDATCFHLLLLVTLFNALWFASSVVPMATNAHDKLVGANLVLAAASIAIGWPIVAQHGITFAPLALLLNDGMMLIVVLRVSFRLLHERVPEFVADLLRIPDLGFLRASRG